MVLTGRYFPTFNIFLTERWTIYKNPQTSQMNPGMVATQTCHTFTLKTEVFGSSSNYVGFNHVRVLIATEVTRSHV